jgi:hypothetical protein
VGCALIDDGVLLAGTLFLEALVAGTLLEELVAGISGTHIQEHDIIIIVVDVFKNGRGYLPASFLCCFLFEVAIF